jgi:tetratricopeptide (TPR) repeat protein
VIRMTRLRYSRYLIFLLLLALQGCQLDFSYFELRQAEKASERGDFSRAVRYYRKVIQRAPDSDFALKSARAASRISVYELKDFDLAMDLFEHIVVHATNENERKLAQKELADIAFEKKTDYQRAIVEYNKLLTLGPNRQESLKYKLRIAKSHFYISEFFQAESEIRDALRVAEKGPEKFELELFLANILFNTKRVDQAIKAYRSILTEYPDLSKKEKVEMSLVVSLEETEKFQEAIDLLDLMKKDSASDADFLELKIAKLQERMRNLPGARGLRR